VVSPEDWSQIEANEVRLFVGEPEMGLWCERCQLPSAWRAPVQRDPSEPPGSWFAGCTDHTEPKP